MDKATQTVTTSALHIVYEQTGPHPAKRPDAVSQAIEDALKISATI
jgi:hypothetical protein